MLSAVVVSVTAVTMAPAAPSVAPSAPPSIALAPVMTLPAFAQGWAAMAVGSVRLVQVVQLAAVKVLALEVAVAVHPPSPGHATSDVRLRLLCAACPPL